MYQDKYGRKWDTKPLHDEAMLLRVKPKALHAALKLQYAQGLTPAPARRFFEKNQCYLFREDAFGWEVVIQYADVLGAWDSWILDDRIAEYLFSQHRQHASRQERLAIEAIDEAYPPPGVEHEVWAVLGKRKDGTLPSPHKAMCVPWTQWVHHQESTAVEARGAVNRCLDGDYAGVFRCLIRVVEDVTPTKE